MQLIRDDPSALLIKFVVLPSVSLWDNGDEKEKKTRQKERRRVARVDEESGGSL